MTEVWKTIEGFDRYEVSSLGSVRSKEIVRVNKRIRDGKIQEFSCFYPAKILKPDLSVKGYKRVTLSKDNKTYRFFIHRLVAQAFIPNTENKPFINHKDNNGLNNTVENLEWVTHSENMLWAQKQNRLFKAQSKGGTLGGATMHQKMLNRIDNLKGTYVNDWKVIGDIRKDKPTKWKVLCECKCGARSWIDLYRLDTNNKNAATCCRTCGNKDKDIV